MTESEKRIHRCCFTGYRPEKLSLSEDMVKTKLKNEIRLAIADGINVFITGMAPGVDIWAAEVVLELCEKEDLALKLIGASPHPGFKKRWSLEGQKKVRLHYVKSRLYQRGLYSL